ncbi:Capsule polysaccharide export inner-membrane protein BexC [Sphingobium sp. EP60837]|nr:Capsule polysaccharide export inner-membrane protein BexC [Sphingobium sp. EP60837]
MDNSSSRNCIQKMRLALRRAPCWPSARLVWFSQSAAKIFMNVNPSFPIEAEAPVQHSALVHWLKKRRWFLMMVALPTLLAALYYGLIASDVYVSESRFVIKSPDQKRSQMSTLANLVQTTGLSGGQEQTNEVLTYVRSRDALKALEKTVHIRDKFSTPQADFLSRFPQPFADNSFESLFKYYGKRVDARLDAEAGTAIIKVEAFAPQDAYVINRQLLDLSEGLVNRLNSRAQSKGIAEAQKQVELAAQRARNARIALAQYRNAQALIDPTKQAGGVLEIANTMIAERAALQAQLDLMQRLTPNNPSIPALRNRISAISVQIASQTSRVVGSGSGIASKMGGYEDLLVEEKFATESLTAANVALVQARAEALRQQFYLERVVDPNTPDTPLLPKRFLNILVVFAASLCLYFITWMFMIGVLEHAPED